MGNFQAGTENQQAPIRVSIVDDHGLLVESMSSWISQNAPDFFVSCQSMSWSAALSKKDFPGDLVLMDSHLSEPVSVEARVMTCAAAGAKTIIISSESDASLIQRIRDAGASGHFKKTTPMGEILAFARTLFGREPVDHVAPGLVQQEPVGQKPSLSQREMDALALYCRGLSVRDIAASMNCGYETAKTYIRRVREKYARAGRPASRRAELVRRAAEDGYFS